MRGLGVKGSVVVVVVVVVVVQGIGVMFKVLASCSQIREWGSGWRSVSEARHLKLHKYIPNIVVSIFFSIIPILPQYTPYYNPYITPL